MTLRWTYEQEMPQHDYTGVCYTVEDCDKNEVIYRTASKARAIELCQNFNESKRHKQAVESMKHQLEKEERASLRLMGRYRDCAAALRQIAYCEHSVDCATCPRLMKCPVSRLVATARKALLDCGLKVPKGEE